MQQPGHSHSSSSNGLGAEPAISLVAGGLNGPDAGDRSLAGTHHQDGHRSDLGWVLSQPHGNRAIRLFGWTLRKVMRRCVSRLTYDHPAFEKACAAIPPGANVVLAPTHRSYNDFLLCSFLCFAAPELGLRIPYIAAAEEFAKIPLLGPIFTAAQAFYLRRGQGQEDPELTRQVHELSGRGEVIEFFIEGGRSRSRRYLKPKTGLMRCLQGTGRPTVLLPIAISYDRVPEEATLARELAGAPKPRMGLKPLLNWAGQLRRGEIALGRIHIGVGDPVVMAPEDDVRAAAHAVMAGLQTHMAVSTFHLRTFLHHAGLSADDLAWLSATLERCGAKVIDSDLDQVASVGAAMELCYRQQWLHWLYPEAVALWPSHPLLAAEVAGHSWVAPREAAAPLDDRTGRLVRSVFGPWMRDVAMVLDQLGAPEAPLRYATPGAMLPDVPEVHPVHVQTTFEALAGLGVLARQAGGRSHAWGPESGQLADLRERCRAAAEANPV